MYVVLDGFDLGIGIVFPFFPDEKERDLMMNTVAPCGRQRDVVVPAAPGCSRCFRSSFDRAVGAVPAADLHAGVPDLPRRVVRDPREGAAHELWDLAFIGGSAGATLFQGIALGAFLQGINVKDGVFAGDASTGSRRSAC